MEFFNALIAFIRDHLGLRGKAYLALMKDLKVMLAAFACRDT